MFRNKEPLTADDVMGMVHRLSIPEYAKLVDLIDENTRKNYPQSFVDNRRYKIIDDVLERNKELCRELAELRSKNVSLQTDSDRLHDMLEQLDAAERHGCKRGEYCRNCKHSTLVRYSENWEKCVCVYDACAHFTETNLDGETT